ncbi:MAG TPA: hypothetical protein VG323_17015 [Thermoanaerobaculia bacterium]|nr:hypothetical protein [Thermoanaerobaculia bacterium]
MRLITDPQLDALQQQWLDGGSALPLVRLLVERGEGDQAAAIARLVLAREECPDAAEIEQCLDEIDEAPDEWREQLAAMAADPSVERFEELMRFVPPELIYQRLRNALRKLRKLGVDPEILFQCATNIGMTPEAIELVEEGLVGPETILLRGRRSAARTTYFGLAAEAAFLRGDIVSTIRHLRDAVQHETELVSAIPHIYFVREQASPDVNAMLDRAGIPGIPSAVP